MAITRDAVRFQISLGVRVFATLRHYACTSSLFVIFEAAPARDFDLVQKALDIRRIPAERSLVCRSNVSKMYVRAHSCIPKPNAGHQLGAILNRMRSICWTGRDGVGTSPPKLTPLLPPRGGPTSRTGCLPDEETDCGKVK